MKKPGAKKKIGGVQPDYAAVLSEVSELLEAARHAAARTVNAFITATYWEIGRRIVEFEQGGEDRAEYGESLLKRMASDLTVKYGRGFSRQNLQLMRQFYAAYPISEICQTLSGKSSFRRIVQLPSGQLAAPKFQTLTNHFPLPWSHYVLLVTRSRSPEARKFYETEALRGGWTVKQLQRQIGTQFYERTALSRDKIAILTKGGKAKPEDAVTPEEEIKDPFLLEFLDLKDEYSENDLEEALIRKLEAFLLELGGDFAFVGRQRRLRLDDTWFRVDLVFFHRVLRCLVIVDLKLDELTTADVGQMHLYCNYAKAHWMRAGENPPVGLILCARKGHALARYALEGLPNKVMAAEYKTVLPDEKLLAAELQRARAQLERRAEARK